MVSRSIDASMAAFIISKFVTDPLSTNIDKCRKSNLHDIADYYGVFVSSSLVKAELKVVLLDGLISKGVLSLQAVVKSPRVDAEARAVSSREGHFKSPVRGTPPQQSITGTRLRLGEATHTATVCSLFD